MSVVEMQKLAELLQAVHELTGIKVAIYNLDYDEVISCPAGFIELCHMIRCQEAGLRACNQSEKARCEICRQERKCRVVRCHAGLTEIVIPILNGNSVIGYIMLGQFVGENDREDFLRQLPGRCRELGLEREQLLACVAHVPCFSDAQVQNIVRIVDVIASYIAFSGILYPVQTPLRQTILDHIAKNLSADLSVQTLCIRFSISKSELYRLLRQQAPNGVAAYVRQKRFMKACELLRHTRKPIWQIAEEVGYDNPDYFLRAFKKELGISAGRYRRDAE